MVLRAELIAVGTELLLGDVVNSNAAWLSQALATIGVSVYYHHTVGDNPQRIGHLLDTILNRPDERPDVLIFTGGLGPTPDDLTVETLANYFKADLIHDDDSEQCIRQMFRERQITMAPSNLKQALRPETAIVIENPLGTAPGIWWQPHGYNLSLATFPGVPREMKAMWPQAENCLLAMQAAQSGAVTERLFTRFLHFFGVGESLLAEIVSDLLAQPNPTVAPYVDRAHVKLRLACMASSETEAARQLDPLEATIIQRTQPYYLTTGGANFCMESWVAQMLKQYQVTVGVAESCTGGLLSDRLTNIDGSSAYTCLNVVTYSNAQKMALLNVHEELFAKDGAVSEAVAIAMAEGMRLKTGASIAVSTTGIAGPSGGSDQKPVGLAYIGLSAEGSETMVHEVRVNARNSRVDVKFWISQYALYYLGRLLQKLYNN